MMGEDGRKKISFGFAKKSLISNNTALHKLRAEREREYVDSLEGKEFKTLGKKPEEKSELVIPLNTTIPKWQQKFLKNKEEKKSETIDLTQESLDEIAARELINDAKSLLEERENKTFSIPLADAESEEEDKDEPTMEDYSRIPVTDFGLAMLRGMGWAPGKGIGKNPQVIQTKEPVIRPRGMGLGAELKAPPPTLRQQHAEEDLKLCKGAYVKVTQGPLVGCYGKIEGIDDSCGRVLLRMALGGGTQNICEYMVNVVSPKEYKERSKEITSENEALIKRSQNAAASNRDALVRHSGASSSGMSEYKRRSSSRSSKESVKSRKERSKSKERGKSSKESRKLSKDRHKSSKDRAKSSKDGHRSHKESHKSHKDGHRLYKESSKSSKDRSSRESLRSYVDNGKEYGLIRKQWSRSPPRL